MGQAFDEDGHVIAEAHGIKAAYAKPPYDAVARWGVLEDHTPELQKVYDVIRPGDIHPRTFRLELALTERIEGFCVKCTIDYSISEYEIENIADIPAEVMTNHPPTGDDEDPDEWTLPEPQSVRAAAVAVDRSTSGRKTTA